MDPCYNPVEGISDASNSEGVGAVATRDLSALSERWIELKNAGRGKEAEEFYWGELFPQVRKAFRRKCKDFSGRYEALIMTVGTTPQPLILTLDAVRPRRILFIYTAETEEHLTRVIREVDFLREHEVQYDRERVDPDDPEAIYEIVGRYWDEWTREGLRDIALDNTGGKKSMVSAAAAAANFLGADLLYVDHETYLPELRAPKPGSEYVTLLPNPFMTLGELKIRQCLDLFNACGFEAADEKLCEALGEIRGRRALPVKARLEVLRGLVKGFSLWDRFHYNPALTQLRRAAESARQFEMGLDLPGLEKNLLALEALQGENRGDELYGLFRRNPSYGLHLAVDLYCNAMRRNRAGNPDDAAVRLYRCLEMISQLRLAQTTGMDGEGLNAAKLDWDRSVPPAVRARYEMLAREVFGHDYVRTPHEVSLMHGHILLAAFGDPIWNGAGSAELREFQKMVNRRNNLMLIHGKRRATTNDIEGFVKQVSVMLERLAGMMREDLAELLDQHTFIAL